ncbi:hypothetical protein RchiOBHm_Chr6g0303471 [Rosa chinensis]|uniref:Uncharacterized protein n=1 Tax=Rosa chinensis TaxID=74649 RepID=A0A2P6PZB4_ROSCH|nr:hypothetical protein RchiOBHm_Chr6g0303471 [Rosa chinensis]
MYLLNWENDEALKQTCKLQHLGWLVFNLLLFSFELVITWSLVELFSIFI